MILIADSGSTKTSWYYSDGENISGDLTTSGINPFFRSTEDIVLELREEWAGELSQTIKEVYFYGAGIINEEKGSVVSKALREQFPAAKIEVNSDLLAAARSTLGIKSGIACVLGTGSNSCFYNGSTIVENVSPLGFILGDEGSGAVMGRELLGDYLKGIMPDGLSVKFQKEYPFTYAEFLERVYKQEKPNKFLAQLVPFLHKNIDDIYCSTLVENAFENFVRRNVLQYSNSEKMPISFVGSVAYYFQNQVKSVLKKNKLSLGEIEKNPMRGLTSYHKH